VIYVVAVVAGLATIGAVLIAVGFGYEVAHSRAARIKPMVGVASVLVVLLGMGGAVLGAAIYVRINSVAVVTVPDKSDLCLAQSAVLQPAQDAWLHFQADSQDFIGGGTQKVWTNVESNFATRGTKRDVQSFVSGQGDNWTLEFRAPSDAELRTGIFNNAERAPFVTGKAPGLDIDGDGRGCNTLSGRFSIRTLTWTKEGTIAEMDVLFEQHCEKGAAALRGELWFTTEVGVHRTPPSADSAVNL